VSKSFVTPTKEGTLLNVRISPGAQRTSVAGAYGEDAIKLRVAAPPVEGRTNTEAERLLAGLLGVAASDVSVVKGASSRNKAVLVRGAKAEEVRQILSEHLS
jgi:uncharacterized protein (TIGR00251 family)